MKELTHKDRSWRGPAIDPRTQTEDRSGHIIIDGETYHAQINDDDDCPVSIWKAAR